MFDLRLRRNSADPESIEEVIHIREVETFIRGELDALGSELLEDVIDASDVWTVQALRGFLNLLSHLGIEMIGFNYDECAYNVYLLGDAETYPTLVAVFPI